MRSATAPALYAPSCYHFHLLYRSQQLTTALPTRSEGGFRQIRRIRGPGGWKNLLRAEKPEGGKTGYLVPSNGHITEEKRQAKTHS